MYLYVSPKTIWPFSPHKTICPKPTIPNFSGDLCLFSTKNNRLQPHQVAFGHAVFSPFFVVKVTLFEKNSQVGGRCQSMESTKVKGYRFLAFVEGFFGCLEVRNICFLFRWSKKHFLLEKRGWSYYLLFVVCCCGGVGGWWRWGVMLMVGHKKHQKLGSKSLFVSPQSIPNLYVRFCDHSLESQREVFSFNGGKPEQPTILVILSAFFRLEGTGKVWQNVTKTVSSGTKMKLKQNWFILSDDLLLWKRKNPCWSLWQKNFVKWRNTPTQTYFAWERHSHFQNASYSSLQ